MWDKALECGIPSIDSEHKELFRQVGILMDESRSDRAATTLDFLSGYVVKHFTHEQIMHKASKYPASAAHKEMHDRFVVVYSSLRAEYERKGNNPETLIKIIKTIELWLRDHIMGMDCDFAEYYKKLNQ